MRVVLRELLATGIAVALYGCAGSPPPAVIEPASPEADPPPVVEVAPEPVVELEPEPVRDPEPPLADRWRAPFAVSSSGRVMTRSARSVTVLDADPAIAAGLSAVNDPPSTPPSSRGAGASPEPGRAGSGASTAAATITRSDTGVRLVGDPIEDDGETAASSPSAGRGATGRGGVAAPAGSALSRQASTLDSGDDDDADTDEDDRVGTPSRSVPGPATRVRTYTVESGDSWIGIARDHGVSFSELQEANPGVNPERIRIGQDLRIPPSTRAPAERSHRVGSGDTLSEIAERYGVSVRSIRTANDLSSDVIRQGQVLTIPAE